MALARESLDEEEKKEKETADDAALEAQKARERANALRRALEAKKSLSKFCADCAGAMDEGLLRKMEVNVLDMEASVAYLVTYEKPVSVGEMVMDPQDQEGQDGHNDPKRQTNEDDTSFEDNDGNLMYITAGGKEYWIDGDGEIVFAEDFDNDVVLEHGETQAHQAM
jgi:hypothetical protein